jgi:hypothetical protein
LDPNDFVLVHKAESIIQREALLNELAQSGIEAITSPRDMSRKISDSTVDLALEGYSAIFDGCPLLVRRQDQAAASEVIKGFLRRIQIQPVEMAYEPSPHFRRFFFCSLFGLSLPVIMHLAGGYQLFMALKNKEKIRPFYFSVSLVLFAVGMVWAFSLLSFFKDWIVSRL